MGNTCSRFLSGSSPTPPPPAPSDGGSNKSHGGGGSVKPTGDSSHGGSVKPPAGGSSHGGSSHRPPPSDSVHKPSPHESPLPQVMTVDSPKSETTRNDSLPKASSPQDHSPDNTITDTNADDSSDSDDGDHDPHINNSFNKTEDDNYASNANDTVDRSSSDSSDAPDVDGAHSTYLPTFTNENNDSSSDDDDAQYLPSLTNNAAKSDDPLRNNSNASSATYTTNYAEPIHQNDSNLYDDLYQDADAFDFDSTTDDFDSNTDTSPPKSQIEALSLIKPLPTNKNIKTKDDDKPKKPVRTRSSIDFVLGRKTPNVKEFYNMGQKLGEGQFGTTFLCTDKASGREYACKSIAKRKLRSPEDVEDVRREIQIMHHLEGNPHVVQIVAAFEDTVAVHVVMELCEGGELFDRIIERGHYTERKAAELARTIVEVVEGCHSLGVMHRDLKPENFLFVDEDEDSLLKTIDFGLSIFFRPGETFGELVGSPYYVAPEVLNKCYGPEIDVWSAGVVLYILLCGVPPFWDETESGIFDQVLKAELDFVSEPWPDISDSAKDLIGKMLERDPKKRLTAHEVLCHPWIREDGDAPDKPLDSAVLTRLKQFSSMNKLKRIVIRVIAETLSEEQIAGLKQMFKTIDADDSGHITLEELKIGLEQAGANLQDSEIIKLMKAADADNSGTIDYSEFVAAMLHLNKVQREDHLFAAFTYFDKDGSGYITKDEIQQACQQFGLADVHLEELIREADQDNDGSIDYSEFVDMMHATDFGKKHY